MQQLHSDLWIADSSLRFVGLEIGARMTVVRLPGGELLIHSPIAATEDLVGEVKALGSVAYLVAPNRFHHLFVAEWLEACPEASIYVAPGLDEKRPDLEISGVLTDEPEPGWAGTIDQLTTACTFCPFTLVRMSVRSVARLSLALKVRMRSPSPIQMS